MAIRTTSASRTTRLLDNEMYGNPYEPVTRAAFGAFVEEATRNQGPQAGKALQAAYDGARARLGRDPTIKHVEQELKRAAQWLKNADFSLDGFVDDREAARGDAVAVELYGFTSAVVPPPLNAPTLSATTAQADKAASVLNQVLAKAAEIRGAGTFNDALQKAADTLGYPAAGKLLVDWSGIDGTGTSVPDAFISRLSSKLSKEVDSRRAAIAAADGKPVLDFDHPSAPATVNRDGVTTDLEFDRSRAPLGVDLLSFAATL